MASVDDGTSARVVIGANSSSALLACRFD